MVKCYKCHCLVRLYQKHDPRDPGLIPKNGINSKIMRWLMLKKKNERKEIQLYYPNSIGPTLKEGTFGSISLTKRDVSSLVPSNHLWVISIGMYWYDRHFWKNDWLFITKSRLTNKIKNCSSRWNFESRLKMFVLRGAAWTCCCLN